jgi:hypothetical protein
MSVESFVPLTFIPVGHGEKEVVLHVNKKYVSSFLLTKKTDGNECIRVSFDTRKVYHAEKQRDLPPTYDVCKYEKPAAFQKLYTNLNYVNPS